MEEKINTPLRGTEIEYLPSASAATPDVVPLRTTLAKVPGRDFHRIRCLWRKYFRFGQAFVKAVITAITLLLLDDVCDVCNAYIEFLGDFKPSKYSLLSFQSSGLHFKYIKVSNLELINNLKKRKYKLFLIKSQAIII